MLEMLKRKKIYLKYEKVHTQKAQVTIKKLRERLVAAKLNDRG